MIIDYAPDRVFTKALDIVDPGNCAIRCVDKEGLEYYVVVKTILGNTSVLKFGPVIPDIGTLEPNFKVEFFAIDFDEDKIESDVGKFVNDGRRKIVDLVTIEPEEALAVFPDIKTCWDELYEG